MASLAQTIILKLDADARSSIEQMSAAAGRVQLAKLAVRATWAAFGTLWAWMLWSALT